MKKNLKKQINALIAENKLRSAFELIRDTLEQRGMDYAVFSILSRQYNDNHSLFLRGVIDYEAYSRSNNRICDALFELLEHVDESHLNTDPKDHDYEYAEVKELITVFAANSERIEQLIHFFSILRFKNIRYFLFKEKMEDKLDFDFDELIIFDNTDLPTDDGNLSDRQKKEIQFRTQLMDEFLENCPASYFLHFGPTIHWLNDTKKRLRVSAANSPITLYARIKEIIQFMNAYRV